MTENKPIKTTTTTANVAIFPSKYCASTTVVVCLVAIVVGLCGQSFLLSKEEQGNIATTTINSVTTHARNVALGLSFVAEFMWNVVIQTRTKQRHNTIVPTKLSLYVVGQGRTGTTSLAAALRMLGYNVLHDDTAYTVIDVYGQYCRGELDLDTLHDTLGREKGYNCSFFRDGYRWAATQPDVKVIVTTRNPQQWVDSWLVIAPLIDFLYKRPFCWYQPLQDVLPHLEERSRNIPTGGQPEGYLDRDTLLRGYHIHLENVRRAIVPSERLLEFDVSRDGWKELCAFLSVSKNCPNHQTPFPHINERLRVRTALWLLQCIVWTWPLWLVSPIVCVLSFGYYRHGRRGGDGWNRPHERT